MLTFLHAADIHLDSPLLGLESYPDAPVSQIRRATRRAFSNLIDLALEERVAFVLLAGDIYDGDWKDYNTGLFFIHEMSRLRAAGIQVFLVSGNHDAASQISRSLSLPDNVRSFSSKKAETFVLEEFGVAIHGRSYPVRDVSDNLARDYPPALPAFFNIGLLHTALTGREGHAVYAPCTLDELRAKDYDYWALGHIHQREELGRDPVVLFPGNLQGRHIRETGAKGASLVVVEDGRVLRCAHRPLDVLRWARCRLDLAACDSLDAVSELVRQGLLAEQERADGRVLAVRLELVGASPVHAMLHAASPALIEEFRGLAAGLGEVWLEKICFDTVHPVDSAADPTDASLKALSGPSPLSELAFGVDRLDLSLASMLALSPELAAFRAKLPSELLNDPEFFLADSGDLASELRSEVRELLLGRLRAGRKSR